MFERLLQAMGRRGLLDRFGTMEARLRLRPELDALVADWVGGLPAAEVLRRLGAAEVPSALVASVRDLFEDPQVKARENILTVESPLGGVLSMVGIVPRLSLTPGTVESAGPVEVGQHNEEIYCERLGLTRAELASLAARGIV
jgi:crotonobetainyl-CoA:carnitine CoA-transferase CaiB-like acyl-CoA transferase